MASRARVGPWWVGSRWVVAHGWVRAWRRVETWRHVGAIRTHVGGDKARLRYWMTWWLVRWGSNVCRGQWHAWWGLHHSWGGTAWGGWGSTLLLQKWGCRSPRIRRGWLIRHLCCFWTSNPWYSEKGSGSSVAGQDGQGSGELRHLAPEAGGTRRRARVRPGARRSPSARGLCAHTAPVRPGTCGTCSPEAGPTAPGRHRGGAGLRGELIPQTGAGGQPPL